MTAKKKAKPSKKRPLRRSYAGVAPSVSPKKRRPTLRERLADLQERYALSDNAALRYADDLEATGKREKELREELRRLRKLLAAEKTSVEFWTYEASRWRTEAEDLRRAEAMSRVERGVA
jgi:hypothetical protein